VGFNLCGATVDLVKKFDYILPEKWEVSNWIDLRNNLFHNGIETFTKEISEHLEENVEQMYSWCIKLIKEYVDDSAENEQYQLLTNIYKLYNNVK
jgi:hypothetical protein